MQCCRAIVQGQRKVKGLALHHGCGAVCKAEQSFQPLGQQTQCAALANQTVGEGEGGNLLRVASIAGCTLATAGSATSVAECPPLTAVQQVEDQKSFTEPKRTSCDGDEACTRKLMQYTSPGSRSTASPPGSSWLPWLASTNSTDALLFWTRWEPC